MNALTPIKPHDQSDLVATIERARALLDDGDVLQARLLSASAYEQAKAAGALATRMKASQQLIDKARRLQADALLIESRAGMQLADEVDRAQEAGEVATRGRRTNILSGNVSTLDDLGLTAKDVFEARKLRDAERKEPGIVERAIQARIEAGLTATRKSLGHAIGTRSASKEERGADLYETPIEAIRTLLALESFVPHVLEPSVGKGAILRPLEAAGYEVSIADLIDREICTQHGECQAVGDFLTSEPLPGCPDIVTNPPFGIANAYAAHAMKVHRPHKLALLLNATFMAGFDDPDRRFVMDENPPSRIYMFTRRLPMMHRDGWEGDKASSQMNCAWFVWERNEDGGYGEGYPRLIRVDWAAHEEAAPLPPGAGGHVAPQGLTFRPEGQEFARSTPRLTPQQRADKWIAVARTHLARRSGGVTLEELRREISIGSGAAAAMAERLVEEGFLSPPDADGRMWVAGAEGGEG